MSNMSQVSIRQVVRAYLISIGIWTTLSLLTGWNYLIFDRTAKLHSTLGDMILLAEARGLAYAILTPPIFYIAWHYPAFTEKRSRVFLAYFLAVAPFTLIYASIRWLILPPWEPTVGQFIARTAASPFALIRSDGADMITNYLAIVFAAHAYRYFEKMRAHELERSRYEQALAASELESLRMQLQPHFLFNTLHGISTLIDSNRESAKAMIVSLSALLRRALERNGSDLIPLQDELKFINEYLDLEKMRVGDRLEVIQCIDLDTLRTLVPQMILQPLVENAIQYGIATSRENGWIKILARRSDGRLELDVHNSVGEHMAPGSGVGLKNTEARLKNLFSSEASFSFEIIGNRTASARISIPVLGSGSQASESQTLEPSAQSGGSHARIDH
jgi:two-component system, LytTR family, sensor kinase